MKQVAIRSIPLGLEQRSQMLGCNVAHVWEEMPVENLTHSLVVVGLAFSLFSLFQIQHCSEQLVVCGSSD